MEDKKTNRYVVGNTLIVHEGLQNNPDLKKKLLDIADEVNTIANNDSSHLSDVGAIVCFLGIRMKEIGEELFRRHETEQKLPK